MFLTAMNQHRTPEPNDPFAKDGKAISIAWDRVVVEVTLDNRSKPLTGYRYGFVPAFT